MTAGDKPANPGNMTVTDDAERRSERRSSSYLIQKLRQLSVRLGLFVVMILEVALSDLLIEASTRLVVDEPRQSFPYLFGHGVFVGAIIGFGFLIYGFLLMISRLLGGLRQLPERNDSLFEESAWEVAKMYMPQELQQVEAAHPLGRVIALAWFVAFIYAYYPAVVMIHEIHGLLLSFRRWLEHLNASLRNKIDHFNRWAVLFIAVSIGSVIGFVSLRGIIGPIVGGGIGLVVGNRLNKFLERRYLRVLWKIWLFIIASVATIIGGVVAAGPEAFIDAIHSVRALLGSALAGEAPIQGLGALGLGLAGGFAVVVLTPLVLGLFLGGVLMIGLGIPQTMVRSYISDYLEWLRDAVPTVKP